MPVTKVTPFGLSIQPDNEIRLQHSLHSKMPGDKDKLDIVQQFIDKNKDSFGQIGFGGGTL